MCEETCRTEHTRADNVYQRYMFYSCDCTNRRNFSSVLFNYDSSGTFYVVRIFYSNRGSNFTNRQHRARMKHLCPKYSEFLSLFISHFGHRFCIFYNARICRHNSVDVFPCLDFFSPHCGPYHSCS